MDARVAVAGVIALAACRDHPLSQRERVLTKVSSRASLVLVADGKALASPAFRSLIDLVKAEGPLLAPCVISAALASDEVGITRSRRGTTIVLAATTAPRCTELSKIDDGMWVATIGAADLAGLDSIAVDPRFARARSYLASAPVAVVVNDPVVGRFLATAQPDPLEAWLAVDVADDAMAAAVERELRAVVARLAADPATAVASSHLSISRDDRQIVARLDGATGGELAAIVRTGVRAPPILARDAIPAMPPAPHCPRVHDPVVDCRDDGATLIVTSLSAVADLLGRAELAPHVTSGQVDSLRVTREIESLGLVVGDEILDLGGRHVTRVVELVDGLRGQHGGTSLSFRRAGRRSRVAVLERSEAP